MSEHEEGSSAMIHPMPTEDDPSLANSFLPPTDQATSGESVTQVPGMDDSTSGSQLFPGDVSEGKATSEEESHVVVKTDASVSDVHVPLATAEGAGSGEAPSEDGHPGEMVPPGELKCDKMIRKH